MLGKLIKYDIAALFKGVIPILAVMVGSCAILSLAVCGVWLYVGNLAVVAIVNSLPVVAGVIAFCIAYVMVFCRYYRNLMSKEGQLFFAVPASNAQHLASKLITGILAIMLICGTLIFSVLLNWVIKFRLMGKTAVVDIQVLRAYLAIMGINSVEQIVCVAINFIAANVVLLLAVFFVSTKVGIADKRSFTTGFILAVVLLLVYATVCGIVDWLTGDNAVWFTVANCVTHFVISIILFLATKFLLDKKLYTV